jgi:hypothetical protein
MLLISIDCAIPKKNIDVISSIMTSHKYRNLASAFRRAVLHNILCLTSDRIPGKLV